MQIFPAKFPVINSNEKMELPKKFQVGFLYVFHNKPKLRIEEISRRLRELKFDVFYEPKGPEDLLFATLGGPFYEFRVGQSSRKISIKSRNCQPCLAAAMKGLRADCLEELLVQIE
jgi:hypothetical protein